MMTFTISAPIKLLSLNEAFKTLRNGRRARSQEYVEFSKTIKALMSLHKKEFKAFNDAFIPTEHEIHAHLVINTPKLYTKAGTISKKSGDCPNYEKCLIDNLMTGSIDDSQIVFWIIRKQDSHDFSFALQLKIVQRSF